MRRTVTVRAPVQIVRDGYGWSAFIAGVPVAADGATYAEALIELVDALREYATDWNHHLRHAANHKDNRGLRGTRFSER